MLYAKSDNGGLIGDLVVVAADTDATPRKIRVVSYVIVAAGGVTAQWFSDASASNVPLTGPMTMITGTSIYPGFSCLEQNGQWAGHFETAAGKGLILKAGGAIQISGHLNYILVR